MQSFDLAGTMSLEMRYESNLDVDTEKQNDAVSLLRHALGDHRW